ncbi:CPBP family intramembrane metalloprotease, partial [Dietzia sp. DQ11-71]|nr:CPBP family intramembrane metalloprotease [Dietzia sp. DQ11-71]
MTPPPPAPPGLWTTPVRGRAALSALAWVLVYGTGLVVVVLIGLVAARTLGTGRPDTALLALVVLAGTAVA